MIMKMKPLTLSVLISFLALSSCKKESNSTTTPPPDPAPVSDEQMAPTSGKSVHYFFNGNTRDTSGNNLHGGESVDLEYGTDRFGRNGRALVLNGTNARTDISGQALTFPFSFSLWVNTPSPQSVSTIFQTDKTTGAYYGCWLQQSIVSSGKLAFNFGSGGGLDGDYRNSLLSSVALSANQWHHIVVNVRGAGDMDLYINGVKDTEATYNGNATTIAYGSSTPTGNLGSGFGGQYFSGKVDDFRAYNRALTPSEITALKNFQP
jgi:Concanavalin A-like lectin/glucanases superfamily